MQPAVLDPLVSVSSFIADIESSETSKSALQISSGQDFLSAFSSIEGDEIVATEAGFIAGRNQPTFQEPAGQIEESVFEDEVIQDFAFAPISGAAVQSPTDPASTENQAQSIAHRADKDPNASKAAPVPSNAKQISQSAKNSPDYGAADIASDYMVSANTHGASEVEDLTSSQHVPKDTPTKTDEPTQKSFSDQWRNPKYGGEAERRAFQHNISSVTATNESVWRSDFSPLIERTQSSAETAHSTSAPFGQARSAQSLQVVSVVNTGDGGMELRLDPPDLGRVHIEFSTDPEGRIRATLTAERPETLDLARRYIDVFKAELAQRGFGDVDLRFMPRQFSDHQQGAHHGKPKIRYGRSSSFATDLGAIEQMALSRDNIDIFA